MGDGEGEGGGHQVDGVHQGKDQEESGQNNVKQLDELKILTFTCGMFFGASTGQSRKHCKKTVKSVK